MDKTREQKIIEGHILEINELVSSFTKQIIKFADKIGVDRNALHYIASESMYKMSMIADFTDYKFNDEC